MKQQANAVDFDGYLESLDDGGERMKPLVIYHANCADGFGAAAARLMTGLILTSSIEGRGAF